MPCRGIFKPKIREQTNPKNFVWDADKAAVNHARRARENAYDQNNAVAKLLLHSIVEHSIYLVYF